MRLARNSFIIGLITILLFGCAQLGTIEGGAKDAHAPKVIKSSVKNGSTNFNQRFLEWQFDEYFQLNNPQTTISLTPSHSRLKTSSVGKRVKVEFLDSLESNTTYQLLFNGTVKDINEGNDSLMIFVFSTGPVLDSAFYQAEVIDAFNYQPVKKVFVGLFDSLNQEPKYLQKTNDQGKAMFSFIKPGNYSVLSWEDQNNNGKYDSIERVAFRNSDLILTDSIVDSIPLRLAKPEFNKPFRNATLLSPGIVSLGVNEIREKSQFYFQNEQPIKEEQLLWIRQDSLMLSFNSIRNSSAKLYLKEENSVLDSIKISSASEDLNLLKLKNTSTWIMSIEPLLFETTDFIDRVDVKKIIILDKTLKDTLRIEKCISKGNRIELHLPKNNSKEVDVIFDKESIVGKTGIKTERFTTSISIFSERELGVLKVDVSLLESVDLIQLILKDKVITTQKKSTTKELEFKNLIPGEYSFRVIRDQNNNMRWDGWQVNSKIPPEKVLWFSQPVKVRANWEIKTELNPKGE